MRGLAARFVLLAGFALFIFTRPVFSQSGGAESLSGPDNYKTGPGPHGHLLGDWGGVRSRLQERGVAFDFQSRYPQSSG